MKKSITFIPLLLYLTALHTFAWQKVANHPGAGSSDPAPNGVEKAAPVVIYGEIAGRPELQELEIRIWDYFIGTNGGIAKPDHFKIKLQKGSIKEGVRPGVDQLFRFSSESYDNPVYFSLLENNVPVIKEYLLFPRDSIQIRFEKDQYRILFQGPDKQLFDCQYEMDLAGAAGNFGEDPVLLTHDAGKFEREDKSNQFGRGLRIIEKGPAQLEWLEEQLSVEFQTLPALGVLEKHKPFLTQEAFELLYANLWSRHHYGPLQHFFLMFSEAKRMGNGSWTVALQHFWDLNFKLIPDYPFTGNQFSYAKDYVEYLILSARMKSLMQEISVFDLLGKQENKILSEKTQVAYLIGNSQEIVIDRETVEDLIATASDYKTKEMLTLYQSAKGEGVKAYPFVLPDPQGKEVALEDLKGKWLFLDFWYTGCGGCVQFYKQSLSHLENHFQEHPEFAVVSINTDKNGEIWLKSLKSENYTSEKSINLSTGGKDHPLLSHYDIHVYPYQIMINPEGQIHKTGDLRKEAGELIAEMESLLKMK